MTPISIIICCYNSATRLPKTLEYLAKQEVNESIAWEVIVVDNNSTDSTASIAQSEWLKYNTNVPLKLFKEPNPGLSNARKRGVLESQYDIIIFCDDDNWLDPQYISTAASILYEKPKIGAVCGQSTPASSEPLPNWFTTFQRYYAVGVPALDSGDMTKSGWLWGAGMALRRNLMLEFYKAGFSNITTDRKGDTLTTGGDVEICKWITMYDYRLWYDERLKFTHFIPQQRLTKDYLVRLMKSNAQTKPVYKIYDYVSKKYGPFQKAMLFLNLIVRIPYKLFTHTFFWKDKIILSDLFFMFNIKYPLKEYSQIKRAYINLINK